MPLNFRTATASARPNAIEALPAATVFNFTNSKGENNGPCLRVKDSKVGKGRFVNLVNGKLLKSTAGDRVTSVLKGTTLVVS